MDDVVKLKVSKNTQKFIGDLAELPLEKHHKVRDTLRVLEKQ